MPTHVVISHGSDFFGQDRYSLTELDSLADYAAGCLSLDERDQLVRLLKNAGGGDQHFTAAQAAELASLLRRIARHPWTKDKIAARARLLADAAARAASDRELWTWTLTTVERI
ncbi:hypothetical protein JHN49_02195 [Streptomyces sp. MBT57]|nr:hypothetical protein [Streptomyces sp. MBT57]